MGTNFDLSSNLLYVWRYDDPIVRSKESDLDPHFILHYNDLKVLIAISVIDALTLGDSWGKNPLRDTLPAALMASLDIWFAREAPQLSKTCQG